MPVSAEQEQRLVDFVSGLRTDTTLQAAFNQVESVDALKQLLLDSAPGITGSAVIPMEQATRAPKILIDSAVEAESSIAWRLLRCPGGPLVLQLICTKANFAIWMESC